MMTLPPRTERERFAHIFLSALLFLPAATVTAALVLESQPISFFSLIWISALSVIQILAWWFSYVSRSTIACSPICLQLVPGFRRRVVINTLLMMAGLSAALTAIFAGIHEILALIWIAALSLSFGSPKTQRFVFAIGSWIWLTILASWLAFDMSSLDPITSATTGANHLALLWGTAASLIGLLAVMRLHQWLGIVCGVVYWFAIIAGPYFFGFSLLPDFYARDFVASPAYALGMIVIAFFLCGLTLKRLGGQRGERAIASFRRDADLRAIRAALTDTSVRANWQGAARRSFINNDRFLRAARRIAKPMQLLPYGLGPKLDWVSFALVCAVGAALPLLFSLLLILNQPSEFKVAMMYAALAILFSTISIPDVILRTNREQSLLSLTPAWPSRNTLNRWLVAFIAVRVCIAWAACVLSILSMNFVHAHSMLNVASATAIVTASLSALLIFGYCLKNYSKVITGHRFSSIGMMTLLLVSAIVGVTTHYMHPTGSTTIVMAGVVAGFVAWRMWKIVRGPAILPAIRLAK